VASKNAISETLSSIESPDKKKAKETNTFHSSYLESEKRKILDKKLECY
jgi:hypothetical protein